MIAALKRNDSHILALGHPEYVGILPQSVVIFIEAIKNMQEVTPISTWGSIQKQKQRYSDTLVKNLGFVGFS